MPLIKIVGDVLEAFAIEIDLDVDLDKIDLDTDEAAREAIAQEIGIKRYLRERDFCIDYIAEIDPITGEEIVTKAPAEAFAGAPATYAIITPSGTRRWTADTEAHAQEQHLDSFPAGSDPNEAILGVCRLTLPDAVDGSTSAISADPDVPSPAYIAAARAAAQKLYADDELEIDDDAAVEKNSDGAFVAAYRWVTNEEIGLCLDCDKLAAECPVNASPGYPFIVKLPICIADRTHLACKDQDGFCNRCGFDDPIPESANLTARSA